MSARNPRSLPTPASDEFLALVSAGFPTAPVPSRILWAEAKGLRHDVAQSAQKVLADRPWPEVAISDWRKMTSDPCLVRDYLEPKTFLYYLPSLLIGVLSDMQWVYLAVEGILPYNRAHYPKGKWWKDFDSSISVQQRAAIQEFIRILRTTYWTTIGDVMQAYLFDAEEVWGTG